MHSLSSAHWLLLTVPARFCAFLSQEPHFPCRPSWQTMKIGRSRCSPGRGYSGASLQGTHSQGSPSRDDVSCAQTSPWLSMKEKTLAP